MMRSAFALLLAAACGGGGSDAPSDGSELRPDGDHDMDLDGVKDDVDNCPTATNAFQGNEDGDRFGDACDPCPIVADDNPADADGDGVGDACDPLPNMFGDRIAYFEGFHQGVPQGWDQVGTWSTANDQLVGSASGEGHVALIVTDRTREIVRARITYVASAGAAPAIGVLDNKAQASASAVACTLGGGSLSVFATTDSSGAATVPATLTAGQTVDIALQRVNSQYTCATAATSTSKAIALANTPFLSGITIADASVRIDWLMVVESL